MHCGVNSLLIPHSKIHTVMKSSLNQIFTHINYRWLTFRTLVNIIHLQQLLNISVKFVRTTLPLLQFSLIYSKVNYKGLTFSSLVWVSTIFWMLISCSASEDWCFTVSCACWTMSALSSVNALLRACKGKELFYILLLLFYSFITLQW